MTAHVLATSERLGETEQTLIKVETLSVLTPAQYAIAALVAAGLSNKQISRKLNICEATVKAHLLGATKRLKLTNRVQLAVWYVRSAADVS